MTTEQTTKRGLRKNQVGVVTSTAMQKTVKVAVDRLVHAPPVQEDPAQDVHVSCAR